MAQFSTKGSVRLRMLDDEQIARIRSDALSFLEETGAKFESERTLDFLESKGCSVDHESGMVRFPAALVEQAIADAPETFDLYNSAGQKCMELGRGNTYFAPGPGSASVAEVDGTKRSGTMADLDDEIQIAQKSPYLDMVAGTIVPGDYPGPIDLYMLYQGMRQSSKPILGEAMTAESLERVCEIIEAFCGGKGEFAKKPFFLLSSTPAPPLRWDEHAIDIAWKCAEYGIPLMICSSPIMGVSAPITAAGGILQHTIENLSFLTFVQLLHPGLPVFYGCICGTMDMRTTYNSVSGAESALCVAGIAAMAHHFRIPSLTFFSQSDSKLSDYQAGFETCLGALVSKLSGIDVVFGAGTLDGYGLTSKEKMAIDGQLLGYIQLFGAGVCVDDDTLGKSEIEEVLCGEEETFIQREHTVEWLRESQFIGSGIVDRSSYPVWKAQGANIIERASDEMGKMLYEPYRVDDELAARIDAAFSE